MMSYCIAVFYFVIFIGYFDSSFGVLVPMLKITNGTSIGLLNLWKLVNISCGNITTENFFRSDLIDKIQPSTNCPDFYYMKFLYPDGTHATALKFTVYPTFEAVLAAGPIYATPISLPATHQSAVNTSDNFEYKMTDSTGTYLYAGILNPSNKTDNRYLLDMNGYNLNTGLPTTSNIVAIEIDGNYAACTGMVTQSPVDVASCTAPPSIVAGSAVYNFIYGDNVTMKCTVSSQIPIKDTVWETVLQGNIHSNMTSPGDMVLNIVNVTFSHGGTYSCGVINKLNMKERAVIVLNVTGGPPDVKTTSQTAITKNTSNTVIFDCSVLAVPSAAHVYWKKRIMGIDITVSTTDARFSVASLPSPSLTITNLQTTDAGEYFCVAENLLGYAVSTGITLTVINVNTDLCPCSCEYRAKVDYWASHNVTNMTYEEIVIWLQPKIKELEKTLTLDKSNISAIIYKRNSMKDNRPSAKSLGVFAIVILVAVVTSIVLIDISAISQIKRIWAKKKDS